MGLSVDLVITLYTLDGEDRFKVVVPTEDDVVDVTDQFEVATAVTEDGREAITLIKK